MENRPKASVLGATPTGLALASALSLRFGAVAVWEPDPHVGRGARGAHGIARVSADLPEIVRDSAVVACAVSKRDLVAALAASAQHLEHGAIVIVATIGQEAAHADAARLLPPHVSVACVTTFPPPRDDTPRNPRSPAPVTTAGISPAPGAHPDAVGVVQAIVEATGAVPFFGEAREIDGFAAATLAMPAILGAAAVRATIASPTARDLDRAGAGPLASLTAVVDADVPSPEEIVALRSHIVRLLETLADELSDVAGRLASSDPDHDPAAITNAAERRRSWLIARATPADAPPIEHMPKPERRRLFF